jgi:hypothetical protein
MEVMNAETLENQPPKSSFLKLLATGLIVWVLALVALVGLAWPVAKPEGVSNAIIWAVSHWWVAFGIGALALIIRGLISRRAVAQPLFAYLLPAALVTALVGICQLIFPDLGFREELFGFLPLVLAFYLIGLVWASLLAKGSGQGTFIRSVLPAILGGTLIVGLVAVPVFGSNAFIYHKAFDLRISDRSLKEGAIVAEGVLEIKKPGDYVFSAPRYSYNMPPDENTDLSTIEYGRITWGAAGEPKAGIGGSYPMSIRWEKNVPASQRELVENTVDGEMIKVEVRDAAAEKKELLFSLYAQLPDKGN